MFEFEVSCPVMHILTLPSLDLFPSSFVKNFNHNICYDKNFMPCYMANSQRPLGYNMPYMTHERFETKELTSVNDCFKSEHNEEIEQ